MAGRTRRNDHERRKRYEACHRVSSTYVQSSCVRCAGGRAFALPNLHLRSGEKQDGDARDSGKVPKRKDVTDDSGSYCQPPYQEDPAAEDIKVDRRRFLDRTAMTIAAAQLGVLGSLDAQSNKAKPA